ncbi:hypothetical protein [Thalassobaculum sp.]|uniref:hypothetical protein n=1 Tax=Thalassobaculum sp. TaxID=2022740 RepID=UPI0032ECAF11
MPTTPTQSLSAVAQAVRENRDPAEDVEYAPPDSSVPMAVRLDFAALLTQADREALPIPDSRFGPLPALPALVYAAWRIRMDLYASFDLRTTEGYAGLWVWAIRDGRREIDALGSAVADARPLVAGTVERMVDGLPVSFPWCAALLWCTRPDLQEAYPLSDTQNAAGYLGWFLRNGLFDLHCCDLVPDDHVNLLSTIRQEPAPPPPLTLYLEFMHAARPDIASAFDLGTFESRRAFLKWFYDHGISEFPTHPEITARQTQILMDWGKAAKAERNNATAEPGTQSATGTTPGD